MATKTPMIFAQECSYHRIKNNNLNYRFPIILWKHTMHSEGIFSVHVAMAIKVVQTGMRGCMGKQSQHLIFSPPNTIIIVTQMRGTRQS